jgi:hypothetical protein
MRGDRKCSSEVRNPVERPHMRFVLSCQTMMSTQVDPGTPGYGADKPFNSRCHRPAAGLEPELETRLFPRSLGRFSNGGARRDRTDDLMLAKHALYQLSYGPEVRKPGPLGAVVDLCLSARGVTRSMVWWAQADSNCRPHAYQACALTN